MIYRLLKTDEYSEWFANEQVQAKLQIEKRLGLIKAHGHFGDHKQVTDFVWELKWKNGRRVYYAYFEEWDLLLLIGGNKNGQSQDIRQAKKILERYQESTPKKRGKT